jgi:hypothetical protein
LLERAIADFQFDMLVQRVECLLDKVHCDNEAHDRIVLIDTVLSRIDDFILSENITGLDLFPKARHLRSELVYSLIKPFEMVCRVCTFPSCCVHGENIRASHKDVAIDCSLKKQDAILLFCFVFICEYNGT